MEVVMKITYYNAVYLVEGYVLESGDCDDGDTLFSHFDVDNDGYSSCVVIVMMSIGHGFFTRTNTRWIDQDCDGFDKER